jgi:hypothetical protein
MKTESLLKDGRVIVRFNGSSYEWTHNLKQRGVSYWYGIGGPDLGMIPSVKVQQQLRQIARDNGISSDAFVHPSNRPKPRPVRGFTPRDPSAPKGPRVSRDGLRMKLF